MEQQELWQAYYLNKDPLLKEKLIIYYIVLVQKIAGKMFASLPAHIDHDDLYSYGIFGLLEAVERYNPNLGVPFAGFAVKRIRGSIIDGLRKEDWLPVSVRQKAKQVEQAYERLERQLGRSATDEEIALELGLSLPEWLEWLQTLQSITVLSLEQSFSEEQNFTLKEQLFNSSSPNPLQKAMAEETKHLLKEVIARLPEKERLVISLYYYYDLANKEIAEVLQLSPSRISQLHTKAIFRLRGQLAQLKKSKVG